MIEKNNLSPTFVKGSLQKKRLFLSFFLILLFLSMPWIKINGHQSLLLNFQKGQFAFFGIGFWSHDAPMLFFILSGAAVTLALLTCVYGRVWCGWACPQTVFVEQVFRRVERWIEGDSINKKLLNQSKWNEEKIFKKILKWSIFIILTLILSHSFIAYFVGTHELAQMINLSPLKNPGTFFFMSIVSSAILYNFGYFREQLCISLCPYGRFQSVLMDNQSLIIQYKSSRGEPRKNGGDCINCMKCVNVCPTGIDIRNGVQLECVACTACVDACDSVMKKIGKPLKLIGYSFGNFNFRKTFIRPFLYTIVLFIIISTFLVNIYNRKPVELIFIRTSGNPYEEIHSLNNSPSLSNRFYLDFKNQLFESVTVNILPNINTKILYISPELPIKLEAGESKRIQLFIRYPSEILTKGKHNLNIDYVVQQKDKNNIYSLGVALVGPVQ